MPEDDGLSSDFDELTRDRFLVGSPDEVAAQIVRLHDQTGINHLIMSVHWPGMPPELVLETMQLLAEEVFEKVHSA
jgi:alkanesulfonate monooxygenase SsuD/methylene tetrahydromethanopterin reductase-like flavin-dependent oxidoreductase (luciferase family)